MLLLGLVGLVGRAMGTNGDHARHLKHSSDREMVLVLAFLHKLLPSRLPIVRFVRRDRVEVLLICCEEAKPGRRHRLCLVNNFDRSVGAPPAPASPPLLERRSSREVSFIHVSKPGGCLCCIVPSRHAHRHTAPWQFGGICARA